jgi:hypothetical protein
MQKMPRGQIFLKEARRQLRDYSYISRRSNVGTYNLASSKNCPQKAIFSRRLENAVEKTSSTLSRQMF